MRVVSKIDPQPPRGIKYMLGAEKWLPRDKQSPLRLSCEEWGHVGPMEIDPEIMSNKAGFRVRTSEFKAPPTVDGFTKINGEYFWTTTQ
jgi:hypothetical protein